MFYASIPPLKKMLQIKITLSTIDSNGRSTYLSQLLEELSLNAQRDEQMVPFCRQHFQTHVCILIQISPNFPVILKLALVQVMARCL